MSQKITVILNCSDEDKMPSIDDMDAMTGEKCESIYLGDMFEDAKDYRECIYNKGCEIERLQARLEEAVINAFMAGQANCGIDPSYSSAKAYAKEALSKPLSDNEGGE